ncbi:hypothetical protein QTP88_007779 [Uroleucon formosanum]
MSAASPTFTRSPRITSDMEHKSGLINVDTLFDNGVRIPEKWYNYINTKKFIKAAGSRDMAHESRGFLALEVDYTTKQNPVNDHRSII